MSTIMDSTTRFSDRVANYIRYRPHYPEAIIPYLEGQAGLAPETVIADVGSGTGILSELFLRNGYPVLGVEPNEAMRAAAEELLVGYERYTSVDGTAEATTLADNSVDLIVAGQAFHWFDPPKAREEFVRILRKTGNQGSEGYVILAWNSRRKDTPFMQSYEGILFQYADNYERVSDRNVEDEQIADFFAPRRMTLQTFENVQTFDFEGLEGRALSSSYSPAPGHPMHEPFIERLRELFETHQVDGTVTMDYTTRVYTGKL